MNAFHLSTIMSDFIEIPFEFCICLRTRLLVVAHHYHEMGRTMLAGCDRERAGEMIGVVSRCCTSWPAMAVEKNVFGVTDLISR